MVVVFGSDTDDDDDGDDAGEGARSWAGGLLVRRLLVVVFACKYL